METNKDLIAASSTPTVLAILAEEDSSDPIPASHAATAAPQPQGA